VLCIEPTLFVAPVAVAFSKLIGARAILHIQDLEVDAAFAVGHLGQWAWLRSLAARFERATLRGFDKIITISERMAEKIAEKSIASERIAIVRNWVDLDRIYPLGRKSSYREKLDLHDNFVVLYSGNIGPKQGLNVLLEAARLLCHEVDIKFVVAGEGPSKAQLMQDFGDVRSVSFLPFQPYEQLNEFLNLPDLHVLPQDRGAADLVLPSKLGGMLASGKPIAVTADPGTELAIFLDEAAFLSPSGDSAALAAAILSARSRQGSNGLEKRLALAEGLSKTDGLDLFWRHLNLSISRELEERET